ncbi:MAG: glycosyltransferase [Lewinellaceae bacterium]|nr:glycosyltransferase [Lewinellaceae bacterium]
MLHLAYTIFCTSLSLAYLIILAGYVRGWRRLPEWNVPTGFVPRTPVTVLVPARNEAANIADCLHAILACNYPLDLLEIVVLDDFSEDDTACIVAEIAATHAGQVRLIRLSEQPEPVFSGKKKALELGVSSARGTLIITTDADCLAPANWLLLLVSLYEARRPGAIAAPVAIHREHTTFERFQALDLAGMMGITGAGIGMGRHRMGNGANLCYAKTMFEAVGGYSGNTDRASGDDLFLLGKIAAIPGAYAGKSGILFLKNPDAAIRTLPCPDLLTFVQQRIRWGTKNAALPDPGLKAALAVAFLSCSTIVLHAGLLFFLPGLVWLWIGQLLVKALADYMLLREMCIFFGRRELLRGFWPAFFLHTAYIAGVGAGSLAVRKYVWKGRQVR